MACCADRCSVASGALTSLAGRSPTPFGFATQEEEEEEGRTTAGVGALAGPAGEFTGAAVGTVMPDDGPGAPFTIVGLSATKCVAFRSEPVLHAFARALQGC